LELRYDAARLVKDTSDAQRSVRDGATFSQAGHISMLNDAEIDSQTGSGSMRWIGCMHACMWLPRAFGKAAKRGRYRA
jgi:hypothetical protein